MENECRLEIDEGDVGAVIPVLVCAEELAQEETSDVKLQTIDEPRIGPHLLLHVDTDPLAG